MGRSQLTGSLMALLSAATFGVFPILAKLGYGAGLSIPQLLSYRFGLASVGMWILCAVLGSNPLRITIRRLFSLLTLGIACFGGQSLLFYTSLTYLPASLVELTFYAYPAFVVTAGWLVLRRPVRLRVVVTLVGCLTGMAFLLGGVKGSLDYRLFLALATPLAYTIYLLLAERAMRDQPKLAASSVITSGAAVFWLVAVVSRGGVSPPATVDEWFIVAALAVLSIVSIPLVLAALSLIGSERVSLLGTIEPVVTVLAAVAVLSERLEPVQIAGAALVLAAVIVLQWPASTSSKPLVREMTIVTPTGHD